MKPLTDTAKCRRLTHRRLSAFLDQQRQLWNAGPDVRLTASKRRDVRVCKDDQDNEWTDLRQSDPECAPSPVACQRSALTRLDKACQAFFARVKRGAKPGFFRFKRRHCAVRSFHLPTPSLKYVNTRHVLTVNGLGKFRFWCESLTGVQQARVVVTPRRIKVQGLVETPEPAPPDPRPPRGCDVGIKAPLTLLNEVQCPKRKRDLRSVKRAPRHLARAVKGSNGRHKKWIMLAKAWQRIRERAHGSLHALTTALVNQHVARFVVEDLPTKNLVKNGKLARSIHDQQWGPLMHLFTDNASTAGGWVRRVNSRKTSPRCSGGGAMPKVKLTLSDREATCMACRLVLDRELNAAHHVLQVGVADLPGGIFPVHAEKEGHCLEC